MANPLQPCPRALLRIVGFIGLLLSAAPAFSQLPPTVCLTHAYPGPFAEPSYFDTTVFDGGILNSPADIPYDGWCVDPERRITPGTDYVAKVYSSLGPVSTAVVDKPENLDLVNYLINQSYSTPAGGGYTFGEVQRAIWELIDNAIDPRNGLGTWSQARVNEILADVFANGVDFVPACGDRVAIILQPIALCSGAMTPTEAQVSMIYVPAACLGDYVWEDLNGDGIQNDGNTGVNGVVVNLLDCAGNPIFDALGNPVTTVTADDSFGNPGYYLFSPLVPGCYTVEFELPAGYSFTVPDVGADDLDSDADVFTGKTGPIDLVAGEEDLTNDAGLVRLAGLGDYVWLDSNGNGLQDDGNTGVNGVVVNLLDCAGNPVLDALNNPLTTVTADKAGVAGYYAFTGLFPGCYIVEFELPSGSAFTTQDAGDDTLDSDADPVTGRTGPIVLASGEFDPTNDAGLVVCEVTIDATCLVILPPTPVSADDCDGKVVRMTMVYTGDDCSATSTTQGSDKATCTDFAPLPDTVFIRATEKENPNDTGGKIWFQGTVNKDGTYELKASNGGASELRSATFIHIFASQGGPLLQSVEFHTSCSQPLAAGNQFGANFVLEMETTNGGVAVAPNQEPPTPEDNCVIPAIVGPGCDSKVEALQLLFTGDDCSASNNSQDTDKAVCTEFGPLPGTVFIRATEKENPTDLGGKVWFTGNVSVGEIFELDASSIGENELRSKTFLHIFASEGGALLQSIEFHTSCSQPLNLGDQFGSVVVFGLDTTDSPLQTYPEVEFTYLISNTGSVAISDLTVSDAYGPVAVDPNLAIGESVLVSFTTTLYGGIVNTVSVSANGGDCADEDTVTIEVQEPPQDCCEDGKPRVLTMLYTAEGCAATSHTQDPDKVTCTEFGALSGTDPVYIVANDNDNPNSGKIWFSGWVYPGDTFDLNAKNAGEDRFSSSTRIHILDAPGGNRLQFVEFHTSCSQPLFEGNQFGASLLVGCISENTPIPGDCCEDGKPRVLSMVYTGETCAATSHFQDPSKVTCIETGALGDPVYIVANDNDDPTGGKIWFSGWVGLNDVFDLDASKAGENSLSSETRIHILDAPGGTRLQFVKFHTSCSQPLFVGNQFGASLLVDCTSENEPIPGDVCSAGKPMVLEMAYTAEPCSASDNTQPTDKAVCSETGPLPDLVYIVANDSDKVSDGKIWFQGWVAKDATFALDARNAGDTRFGSATFIHVLSAPGGARLQFIEFHTSCSQDLFVGNQFGSALLVDFTPEN